MQARRQQGDHNCLGLALQLCALRYLGFVPDELSTAPALTVEFIADQLDILKWFYVDKTTGD